MTERATEARRKAEAAAGALGGEATGLVSYSSRGRIIIVGPGEEALAMARSAPEGLSPSVVAVDGRGSAGGDIPVYRADRELLSLDGYLGEFRMRLAADGQGPAELGADLVLDLLAPPLMEPALKPFGYAAPGADAGARAEALDDLSALTGSFEKPEYFRYDPDICAHGRRGIQACNRCLDACPAGAITALAERVEVDPHLCQGGGVCAAVCPTGAMTYSYPRPADGLDRLRALIRTFLEAAGEAPVLVLHDGELGARRLEGVELADHHLGHAVEELASVGMEQWLSALAFGATAVLLVESPQVVPQVRRALEEQRGIANAMLEGAGYPAVIQWWTDVASRTVQGMPEIPPAGYAGLNDKRQTLFMALDHLYGHAPEPRRLVELPAGAPFGTAEASPAACTLCMSCVGVCPAKALHDGDERPQLRFIEANCVQCGMCTRACPEDAIWITPRLLYDAEARRRVRVLHEEEAFNCISCGTPFGTLSAIERVLGRLKGHSMFADEASRARLKMCEECRIKDMMEQGQL